MNWVDLRNSLESTLKPVAPVLLESFGGPWGALIGTALAAHYGVSPTPDAVQNVIQSNPGNAQAIASRFEAEHTEVLNSLPLNLAKAVIGEPGGAGGAGSGPVAPEPPEVPIQILHADNLKQIALAAGAQAVAEAAAGKPILLAFQIGPVKLEITWNWGK